MPLPYEEELPFPPTPPHDPPKPRVVKPSAKYCNIPLEYKFWIQELCANYISGFKGKAVKQGKTQRAIVHTTNLLTQLGGTL